ncbi:hypothetical protein [Thalassobacillus sp. CUG 92003]|uniref:hypothetical protein n=1 Tax=Thalassobacillus sp. CUG 92003 TaxID=2736641 RepID=UPI0015E75354|nr:hypothetical protein [Thalassobacillus sp. CUG 92003]
MIEDIYVEDFTGANDSLKIQSAIDFASNNKGKTVVLGNKNYLITAPIVIRQGIKLLFNYGSQFIVNGNFRVLEVQNNGSLEGAYIAIDDPAFASEVIYLNGKYKYYNVWNRTQIRNINIVHWHSSHKGTGLSLFSGGPGHEISFVDFENIKIAGLKTGLKLVANHPSTGFAWINANRFLNLSLDDCIEMIMMTSSSTIPNEISGNQFQNLQIQPTSITTKILKVSGQFNYIHGMAWDVPSTPVIELTANSMDTTLYIPSVSGNQIIDNGQRNRVNL